MSKTRKDQRLHLQRVAWQTFNATPYTDLNEAAARREALDAAYDRLGVYTLPRGAWAGKAAINRRLRHVSKDAIRHGNPDAAFTKWNGARKVKTGYRFN